MIAGLLYLLGAFMGASFAAVTLPRSGTARDATIATFGILWPVMTLYVLFSAMWDRCVTR